MNEIEAKRKEDKIVKDAMKQLDYIGVERQRVEDLFYSVVKQSKELTQKEFIKNMVFMLSKYFQSTSRQGFIQMKGNLSYQEFCKECYEYLQSLEVKG